MIKVPSRVIQRPLITRDGILIMLKINNWCHNAGKARAIRQLRLAGAAEAGTKRHRE
jgi:hypothetical protein